MSIDLEEVKQALFEGRKSSITTSTFEEIIYLLEDSQKENNKINNELNHYKQAWDRAFTELQKLKEKLYNEDACAKIINTLMPTIEFHIEESKLLMEARDVLDYYAKSKTPIQYKDLKYDTKTAQIMVDKINERLNRKG